MAIKPVSGKIQSQEINDNFSYLDTRIGKIITTPAEGVSAQEIIDAREYSDSLGDRIRSIAQGRGLEYGAVSPNKTTFAKSKNIVGEIVNMAISGPMDNAFFSATEGTYSYVTKVEIGNTYTVSRTNSNRFRIATSVGYPIIGKPVSRYVLNSDNSEQFTFNMQGNEDYIVVYVSADNTPLPSDMQIEEGPVRTPYSEPGEDVKINFANKSIDINAVKSLMPVGTIYGSDTAFDISLKNKRISTKLDAGFIIVGNDTYNLIDGVWSYSNYTDSMSIAIGFNMETSAIEYLPHSQLYKRDDLALLGTIRRDRGIYQINGLHTFEGQKINNPSNDGDFSKPNFIITDSVGNFEADEPDINPINTELNTDYVYGICDELVSQYPEYVSKILGTHEDTGLPIYEYHFVPPKTHGEISYDFPKIYIQAGIHGHEWGSVLTTLLFFRELCKKWDEKDALRMFRFNVHFVFVPLINPWGRNHNANGGSGVEARKNSNGVDLARNFPSGWVYNSDKSSMYYAGEEPLSELETQYVVNFMNNNPDTIFAIDMHNFGNYPTNKPYAFWAASKHDKTQRLLTGVGHQITGYFKRQNIGDNESLTQISIPTSASCANEWESKGFRGCLVELPYEINGQSSQRHCVTNLGNLLLSIVKKYDYIL